MKRSGSCSAVLVGGVVFVAGLPVARASVLYSVSGSTYSQNFDSLPTTPENTSLGNTTAGWTDDNASPGTNFSIVGWYLYHPLSLTEGGFSGHQRVRIGAGSANTGSFMSFGASGSTDRALGSLASNTTANAPPATTNTTQYIGLRLTNTTGSTLDSITLSYDGEQWRDGGAATPVAQNMAFSYSTSATAVSDAGFTSVPTLGYSSPVFTNTGSGAAVNGNTVGKVAVSAVTISGLTWADGTDMWLRWEDINDAGNDHGLAIDNVSFSATATLPEPGSLILLGASVALMVRPRRRK